MHKKKVSIFIWTVLVEATNADGSGEIRQLNLNGDKHHAHECPIHGEYVRSDDAMAQCTCGMNSDNLETVAGQSILHKDSRKVEAEIHTAPMTTESSVL